MSKDRLTVWQQQWRDHDATRQPDALERQAAALERQAEALERQKQPPEPPAEPLPQQIKRKKPRRLGPQIRRALEPLPKLYPPDGKVPDDIPTEVVRGQVNNELKSDTKTQGKEEIRWDTMNRALGRDPRRK